LELYWRFQRKRNLIDLRGKNSSRVKMQSSPNDFDSRQRELEQLSPVQEGEVPGLGKVLKEDARKKKCWKRESLLGFDLLDVESRTLFARLPV